MRNLVLLTLTVCVSSAAEMKGYISDAACGWNNARPGKEAKECAQKCVKGGWDPVFVRDGDFNAYKIPDKAKVMAFVGERVVVTGKIEGDRVTVQGIRKLVGK